MEDIDLWEADIVASVVFEVDYFGRFVDVRMGALWKYGICLTVVKKQVLDTVQRGR
jgi:hypothetical protein